MPIDPQDKHTGMTAEILRALVIYDPSTGIFYWRGQDAQGNKITGTGSAKRAFGKPAGTQMESGYVRIEFKEYGRFGFLRHRLAWLYMTGGWPADQVDHKNTIKGDDRWENLREATNDKNQANRGLRPHNTSGITGVSFHPSQGKWYAELSIGGVRLLHGYHNTKEEAVAARERALVAHGEFAHSARQGG